MVDTKRDARSVAIRTYLNKDRDSFVATMLQYARTFFPDKIADWSEAGLGGVFMGLAAEVGDHMSFYLDHQFSELDPELAVESQNIVRHLKNAGVTITGNAPAVVSVAFAIEVPAERKGTKYVPQASALPIIYAGSVVESDDGILFELTEDIDYSVTDRAGNLRATIAVGLIEGNAPKTFIMMLGGREKLTDGPTGICVSGFRGVDTFSIPNAFIPFREITLANEHVTDIISVTDSDGNIYYEVDALSHDTVFRAVPNVAYDSDDVIDVLQIVPAPFRFTRSTDYNTKLTTLRFGSGDARSFNDDIIPDPSDFAIPLYGKRNFSRFSLDPGSILKTQTLGVSPVNTTITVTYRYGGGLSHNVGPDSIRTISTLRMGFPGNPTASVATQVRASVSVQNPERASGGEDALTLDELRDKVSAAKNAQSRIVTRQDLLARIYTMPSNFGRVFRAGIRANPQNPLATQLFIVSRDSLGRLIVSPDTLKKNLRTYLNQFRMISDAIDILDAQVINFGVEFRIAVEQTAIRSLVLQDIFAKLKRFFEIRNFQIDQPILIDDVRNIIFNTPSVVSVIDLKFRGLNSFVLERQYSDVKYDVASNIRKGLMLPPPGGIFELRYPDYDIVGTAL